ncbi:hypothetical protein [Candidatus Scalindua japonica]|uniref:hypothetical protein n=1 Tax=Candidatus Scalindua japonica TaxID=1284222 RepID=UPI0010562820|nr:hypothetical protein [Candidatus Scalindua japonica]
MKIVRINLIVIVFFTCCLRELESAGHGHSIHTSADSIRQRTTENFDVVNLFKPIHPKTPDSPGFDIYMTPLIIQEIPPGGAGDMTDRFGLVTADSSGHLHIDLTHPVVYYSQSYVELGGSVYQQISYLWCYDMGNTECLAKNMGIAVQGIRMTMYGDGFPAIIEVLDDTSNHRILYVSTTLEETAVNVFGKPLPGRKYSIECNQEDLPDVVVARVVNNGPEPSGPFVYIKSCSHDITTLLCRCENSQFRDIQEDVLYELLPIEELSFVGINDTSWSREILNNKYPRSKEEKNQLLRTLRLPPEF